MKLSKEDLTGRVFSRLTAVARSSDPTSRTRWIFKCDCGSQIEVRSSLVVSGKKMSCGCLGKVLIGESSLKHGHSIGRKSSRTLQSYGSAKARCFNPQKARYGIYGARGITMCPEWRDSFEAFLRDMGECPDGLTLERKDVNGNYEPGNCVWADRKAQARNRRSNITVSHQGKDMVLLDFATLMGVPYGALRKRVSERGQDPHQAVINMRIRTSRGAVTPQS